MRPSQPSTSAAHAPAKPSAAALSGAHEPSAGPLDDDVLSAIDKTVFECCVDVQRGSSPPQMVAFQFVFRHFGGMEHRIRNTDGAWSACARGAAA